MSVKVLSAFLEESESELGTRLVGIVLSSAAWDDGITWLPQEDIAKRARMSERQVRRAIVRLEELGELEVRKAQRGRKRVNVYRMLLGASVPQYERLPIELDDPFSDTTGQIVRSSPPDISDRDDRTFPTAHLTDERKSHVTLAAGSEEPPAGRPRDPVWDELVEQFGAVAPRTNAHARRNKAVADLKRLGADVDGIRRAVRTWPRVFAGATLTDVALATHYPQLSRRPASVVVPAAPEPARPLTDEERAEALARIEELHGRTAGGLRSVS